jgi:hypothetical protein
MDDPESHPFAAQDRLLPPGAGRLVARGLALEESF